MSDQELIAAMARLWVDQGGDSEGIEWCWRQIRDAVAQEELRRVRDSEERKP